MRGILLHLLTLLQRVCLSVCLSSARKRRRARISPPFFFWHAWCSRFFVRFFLTETKAEAALADGLEQFLFRLFVTGVVRHAERKETGLSHG